MLYFPAASDGPRCRWSEMIRTICSAVAMAVMVMVIGMAPAHAVPLDSSGPAPSPTAKVDKALRALVADGHKVRVNVTTRTRADLPKAVRAGEVVRGVRCGPVSNPAFQFRNRQSGWFRWRLRASSRV